MEDNQRGHEANCEGMQPPDRRDISSVTIDGTTFSFAYSNLLPPLSDPEYYDLRDDIADRGVQVAVITDEYGNVIEGKHRMLAAAETGRTDVPTEVKAGMTDHEKKQLALDLNLKRRHLTTEQRQEVVVRLRKDGRSFRQIGEKVGVSPGTARNDVEKATVQNCTVELPDQVKGKDGKVRRAKAKRHPSVIARTLKESERAAEAVRLAGVDNLPGKVMDTKRVSRIAREVKSRERAKQETEDLDVGKAKLIHGEFQDRAGDIADNSIDLIFTDPPYGKEYLPLWSDLGQLAARVLKPGGVLAAYSGHQFLPQVYASLTKHIDYIWTCAVRHTGGDSVRWDVKVRNGWKPIVVFAKEPFVPFWKPFVDWYSGGKEKDAHDWQQAVAEAEHYIGSLCPEGGVVLDPMMGSGTSGIAAVRLGFGFVGIEKEPGAFNVARERIRQVTNVC